MALWQERAASSEPGGERAEGACPASTRRPCAHNGPPAPPRLGAKAKTRATLPPTRDDRAWARLLLDRLAHGASPIRERKIMLRTVLSSAVLIALVSTSGGCAQNPPANTTTVPAASGPQPAGSGMMRGPGMMGGGQGMVFEIGRPFVMGNRVWISTDSLRDPVGARSCVSPLRLLTRGPRARPRVPSPVFARRRGSFRANRSPPDVASTPS